MVRSRARWCFLSLSAMNFVVKVRWEEVHRGILNTIPRLNPWSGASHLTNRLAPLHSLTALLRHID